MSQSATNPTLDTEIARLADAFDAVPRAFLAALGVPYDETTTADDCAWSFAGGQLSVTWRDDVTALWGGQVAEEEARFGGEALIVLRPTSYSERLSLRRALAVYQLRLLRDQGAPGLAALNVALDLGSMRHVAPDGDADGPAVVISVPFTLRVILAPLMAPEDYTISLTSVTR